MYKHKLIQTSAHLTQDKKKIRKSSGNKYFSDLFESGDGLHMKLQKYNLVYYILQNLVNSYNNTKHRTIGVTPTQANKNPNLVKLKQRKIANRKIKFVLGDTVRISKQKGVFEKGITPNWSTELFKIIKIQAFHMNFIGKNFCHKLIDTFNKSFV